MHWEDIISTLGDVISALGSVHCIGGYHDLCRGNHQCIGVFHNNNDIPQCTDDVSPILGTPPMYCTHIRQGDNV